MSKLFNILRWFWKAWPILALLPILFIHITIIKFLGYDESSTNKTFSLLTQIFGVILILYSIDSNIGVIQNKSMTDMLKAYLCEFPLLKRKTTIYAKATSSTSVSGKGKLSVIKHPKTINEKLDYLQEQINEIRKEMSEVSKEIQDRITNETQEVKNKIQSIENSLNTFGIKIEKVTIGDIKFQLLGVMLVVYGSISGYLA